MHICNYDTFAYLPAKTVLWSALFVELVWRNFDLEAWNGEQYMSKQAAVENKA